MKKLIKPYYFTDRALQVGFNINLNSRNINFANFKMIIKPNFPELETETEIINKFLKDLTTFYA